MRAGCAAARAQTSWAAQKRVITRALVLLACAVLGKDVRAQAITEPLTLRSAVRFALEHSPALRTTGAAEAVALGQVEVGRSLQLPQLGVSAELLRATGNVVTGSLFPLAGIPASSGPPTSPPPFDSGAWGSALGIWGNWAFSDLARRMRLVDGAIAELGQAQAVSSARRLEVAFQTADAFLAVATARASANALRANVERTQTLTTRARVLAAQQLRPAADLAQAEAEGARVQTLVIQAEQAEAVARARLAELLGVAGQAVEIAPDAFAELTARGPEADPGADAAARTEPVTASAAEARGSARAQGADEARGSAREPDDVEARSSRERNKVERHPLLQQARATIDAAEQRRGALALEYIPRFDLVAALWLRGSGYFRGKLDLGAAQGLVPDTANWGVGLVAVWPAFDLFVTRARARVADAQVMLERARRDELVQTLVGQLDFARATLEGATRVAAQAAPALEAARAAEQQASARYQAGLAPLIEVAEAQRVLADAELAEALGRAGVLRGRLLLARALGDLGPFVATTGGPQRGGH